MNYRRTVIIVGLVALVLLAAGCAAGDVKWDTEPAGFWAGLWHGLISLVAFVVGLFNDSVKLYESHNTGGWYNAGFLLGVAIFFGSGGSRVKKRKKKKKKKATVQIDIDDKIEQKVKETIRNWVEDSDEDDSEWKDLGQKIEEKVKREIRKWAEKE